MTPDYPIFTSLELYNQFFQQWNDGVFSFDHKGVRSNLRIGQAFHNFMKLEKVQGTSREWCDKLWNTDGPEALEMIRESLKQ
jgi:hypothetical protein